MRPLLCDETIRLGRVIAELMPTESEVHGLLALMQLQASRANARSDRDGRPILLLDWDRRRWDRTLITLGLRSLVRVRTKRRTRSARTLEASIASCHAQARQACRTRIGNKSSATTTFFGSPNRHQSLNSIVQSRSAKRVVPHEGLDESREAAWQRNLLNYTSYPALAGLPLPSLDAMSRPPLSSEKAAGLTANESERRFLQQRAQELTD